MKHEDVLKLPKESREQIDKILKRAFHECRTTTPDERGQLMALGYVFEEPSK